MQASVLVDPFNHLSRLRVRGRSGTHPALACDTVSRKVTETQVCQACDALRSGTCDIASHSPHRVQELDPDV